MFTRICLFGITSDAALIRFAFIIYVSIRNQADGVEFRTGVGPCRVSGNRSRALHYRRLLPEHNWRVFVLCRLRSVAVFFGRFLFLATRSLARRLLLGVGEPLRLFAADRAFPYVISTAI